MPKAIDLKGQKFGAWLVVKFMGPNKNGQTTWRCLCDCGEVRDVVGQTLRMGLTHSCGCMKSDRLVMAKTKHGHARGLRKPESRTYMIWVAMLQRCKGRGEMGKKYYLDRGITVCERWHDFKNFLDDMGEVPPGMSIDRVNNDGNYEPSNCRWATAQQQADNRRQPVYDPNCPRDDWGRFYKQTE